MIDRSLARIAVEGIGRGQRGAEAEADLIAQPQKIPGFRNRDSYVRSGWIAVRLAPPPWRANP